MNKTLTVSLSLNVALLGVACLFSLKKPTTTESHSVAPISHIEPVETAAQHPTRPDWSRLESTDYDTYSSNLREAGCPERVLRDIISADIVELYNGKRDELRQQKQSSAELNESLDHLQLEEIALRISLLGPVTARDYAQAQGIARLQVESLQQILHVSPANISPANASNEEEEPAMPLVFADVSRDLSFSDEQWADLENLRTKFINEIGGLNQNPKDPEYLKRWMGAQPPSDELFRTWFGNEAVTQFQISANNHATGP